jgi:hypothetical protein
MTTMGDPAAQRELLVDLSGVIGTFVGRLRAREEMAGEVAGLAVHAEQIASTGWEAGGRKFPAGWQALLSWAEELEQFAIGVRALADRVEREALAGHEAAEAIDALARELTDITNRTHGPLDPSELRARLKPLVARASAVAVGVRVGTLGDELNDLSGAAIELGRRAQAVAGDRTLPTAKIIAIYRELRAFAEKAATLAARIAADVAQGNRSGFALAAGAQCLSQASRTAPQPAAAPLFPSRPDRLRQMIQEGIALSSS